MGMGAPLDRGQLKPAKRRDSPEGEGVVRQEQGKGGQRYGVHTVGRGSREGEGQGWGREEGKGPSKGQRGDLEDGLDREHV